MTLLDRFRTVPRDKHPDPAVRLAHVAEVPLEESAVIGAVARDDDDARVRRAAVSKLMDPALLGRIEREDADEGVRMQATAMLRDIALDLFEGIGEAGALDAVDALQDTRTLAQIAKRAAREIVALRALSRIVEPRAWGSIARHSLTEATRRGALARLGERSDQDEILSVAINGEYKDTAVAAVDLLSDRAQLELVAVRAKNKTAARRARGLLKDQDEDEKAGEEGTAGVEQQAGGARVRGEAETGATEAPRADTRVPLRPDPEPTALEEAHRRERELAAERAGADAAEREAGRRRRTKHGKAWRAKRPVVSRASPSWPSRLRAQRMPRISRRRARTSVSPAENGLRCLRASGLRRGWPLGLRMRQRSSPVAKPRCATPMRASGAKRCRGCSTYSAGSNRWPPTRIFRSRPPSARYEMSAWRSLTCRAFPRSRMRRTSSRG